ncbi:hypothetical protein BaRGS_00009235 [Batillaria attramentaria]|uniref:Uncharacterized protein n=1 Tax=Batillaria attramentaria TaxID=370345 RepID=A0ABD0LJH8_9CAEN
MRKWCQKYGVTCVCVARTRHNNRHKSCVVLSASCSVELSCGPPCLATVCVSPRIKNSEIQAQSCWETRTCRAIDNCKTVTQLPEHNSQMYMYIPLEMAL